MSAGAQLLEDGLVIGSGYGLGGAGFSIIYNSTGRFHVAYAATFTLGGFLSAQLSTVVGAPLWLSIFAGLASGVVLGCVADRWIYRPLSRSARTPNFLGVFVASLGLLFVVEYGLQMIWVSAPSSALTVMNPAVFIHAPMIVTNVDLLYVAVAWVALGAVAVFMRYSRLGRSLVAVRVNPTLAEIIGIDLKRCYIIIFAIGSLLGSIAGMLYAVKFAGAADMGESFLLYGFIIAFVTGLRGSVLQAGAVGLVVGLIEELSGLVVGGQYGPIVLYGAVLAYVLAIAMTRRGLLGG